MKIIFLFFFEVMLCSYKYLGVERYGEITRNEVLNPESQVYRFLHKDQEIKFKIYPGDIINSTDTGPDYSQYKCEDGAFPIQNKLIEGYEYDSTIENDIITDIKQITKVENKYEPPIKYTPGLRTLKNFIATAFQPLGTTLYVFGAGWDFQDVGTGNEGMTIGISPNWVKFFDDHDVNYTYRDDEHKNESYYPSEGYNEYYYAGLDCSGYVGWAIYNNLYDESLKEKGFVQSSKKIAYTLANYYNYGTWMHTVEGSSYANPNYTLLAQELKVGDILSSNGHVMICLGKCDDGSFIIMHSTPSNSKAGQPGGGVQITAVNVKEEGSKDCEAYRLCEEYIKYFKKWTERYEVVVYSPSKVFNFPDSVPETGIFHWNLENGTITDPDNYSSKSAKEILNDLFKDSSPSPPSTPSGNPKYLIIIIIIIFAVFLIIVLAVVIIKIKKAQKIVDNVNKVNEDTKLLSEMDNNN